MDILARHKVMILDSASTHYAVKFDPEGGLLTPVLDEHIISWQDSGGKLSDVIPRRVGVRSYSLDSPPSRRCLIKCAGVSWAQTMFMHNPKVREQLPESEIFHVLAVNCVLVTVDGYIVLMKRSDSVSYCPGMWHVTAAGYADLASILHFKSIACEMLRELGEEANIFRDDVMGFVPTVFCEHLTGYSIREVCYVADTKLTGEEVLKRARSAKDSWEGKHVLFRKDTVRQMLEVADFVPSAAASLAYYLGLTNKGLSS